MEEDTLNNMFVPLRPKKRAEVFKTLLSSNEFYDIWGEFDRNITDEFIHIFMTTNDVEELITQLPISEEDTKIIHDECIKAIQYVTGPHTPPVRTPRGSNNENETETENESNSNNNSSSGSMNSRKRKTRKSKTRKAKARKSRKAARRK